MENLSTPVIGLLYDSTVTEKINFSNVLGHTTIKFLSDRLILYNNNNGNNGGKKRNANSLKNLKIKSKHDRISKTTRAKLKTIIDTWLSSIQAYNDSIKNSYQRREFQPVFITLTLSAKQKHSDEFINQNLLMRFIEKYKYHTGTKYLFWRAESQENGNIHYHIITDKYMNWKDIRELWNDTQNCHGYIDEFEKIHHHRNPNSTDVKGVKSVKNFIRYVIKYVGKDCEYRILKCRLWGMTDELRKVKDYNIIMNSQEEVIINEIEKQKGNNIKEAKYVKVILINEKNRKLVNKLNIYTDYYNYLRKLYLELYRGGAKAKRKIETDLLIDTDTGEIIEVNNEELQEIYDYV